MVKMRQISMHNLSRIIQLNGAPEASYSCGILGIDFYSVDNIFTCTGREKNKDWMAKKLLIPAS